MIGAFLPFRCNFIIGSNGIVKKFPLHDREDVVANIIEPMACDGLRTICLAYKEFVPRMYNAVVATRDGMKCAPIINGTSHRYPFCVFFNESRRTKVLKPYSKESMSSGTF